MQHARIVEFVELLFHSRRTVVEDVISELPYNKLASNTAIMVVPRSGNGTKSSNLSPSSHLVFIKFVC